MDQNSEYIFPIFISSSVYDLVDLRAELASHLSHLGYKPYLSSSNAFPDRSPNLEPWESCLPVIDSCNVVILIIDKQYGELFDWPHYADQFAGFLTNPFSDGKVSPTHAEFLYAHTKKKRLLIFIRKELISYYQTYRSAIKHANGDLQVATSNLERTLPRFIDIKTLQFIEAVKTTKPIPWITEFEDVTQVKTCVQQKMINELFTLFKLKDMQVQTAVGVLNDVLDGLTQEERVKILMQIGPSKEYIETVGELKKERDALAKTKKELEKDNKNTKQELQQRETALLGKISDLENELGRYKYIPFDTSGSVNYHITQPVADHVFPLSHDAGASLLNGDSLFTVAIPSHCDRCKKYYGVTTWIKECEKCHQNLCPECMGQGFAGGSIFSSMICKECLKKQ